MFDVEFFCSIPALHFPPLQILAQFARPVFLGGGHEHLAAGLARLFQQRQETAAPFHVQFAHHVVNQQNRRRAVDAGEKFRLRHFQRDGQRAFLAFAAELRGGFSVEQQLQIVAMRPDERGAIASVPGCGIAPVPRQNPFSRSADIQCAIPPRRWKCGDTPAAPAGKISAPVRAGRG